MAKTAYELVMERIEKGEFDVSEEISSKELDTKQEKIDYLRVGNVTIIGEDHSHPEEPWAQISRIAPPDPLFGGASGVPAISPTIQRTKLERIREKTGGLGNGVASSYNA